MVRLHVALSFLACVAGANTIRAAQPDHLLPVTAQLLEIGKQVDCGIFHAGSIARYRVISGSAELVNREIEVLVPCVEMPRRMYSSTAGDLESFEVGAVHDLLLARENVYGVSLWGGQDRPGLLYLWSANLHLSSPDSGRP